MSYLDSDFNIFLDKPLSNQSDMTALDFDAQIDSISADKINSGTMQSPGGRTSLDLDEGSFVSNDGLINRVELGKTQDGGYGLIIRDEQGNVIFNFTGQVNLIQSRTGKMQFDFDEEQARWYDNLYVRILIGKKLGLF